MKTPWDDPTPPEEAERLRSQILAEADADMARIDARKKAEDAYNLLFRQRIERDRAAGLIPVGPKVEVTENQAEEHRIHWADVPWNHADCPLCISKMAHEYHQGGFAHNPLCPSCFSDRGYVPADMPPFPGRPARVA